jgi:hypothetical protein
VQSDKDDWNDFIRSGVSSDAGESHVARAGDAVCRSCDIRFGVRKPSSSSRAAVRSAPSSSTKASLIESSSPSSDSLLKWNNFICAICGFDLHDKKVKRHKIFLDEVKDIAEYVSLRKRPDSSSKALPDAAEGGRVCWSCFREFIKWDDAREDAKPDEEEKPAESPQTRQCFCQLCQEFVSVHMLRSNYVLTEGDLKIAKTLPDWEHIPTEEMTVGLPICKNCHDRLESRRITPAIRSAGQTSSVRRRSRVVPNVCY